jgi:osmoprotectant transport system ATP-binding protein
MSDVPAVELRQVSKEYPGGVRAVDGVSCVVPAGQVVALLGPSGCGKTTTLRLINLLEEPSAGQILVRGRDVRGGPPETLRRSIGYVIQEGGLFPHQTVAANVATVPKLLGWPRERIRRRVGEVLELVGLPQSQFGQRMPAELSGGQRQRVGVARALAADPDLLLMDEPFGALDPGTREAIQDEFLRLQGHLKKTVVLVTHDIAEAGKLADAVVLMDHGRIVQQGSLRDLLLHPVSDRASAFLGTQGRGLALEALRLRHLLPDLSPVAATGQAVRLVSQAKLGQVLVALVNAPEHAVVAVTDLNQGPFSARQMRDLVLRELRHLDAGNGEVKA